MNILLLGPPGSGKGTMAVRLQEEFGFIHLSTGNIFRSEMKNETELGLKAKGLIDAGILVPDDITIAMVKSHIKEGTNYLLDGFPRTIGQAEAFPHVDHVIYFEIAKDIVVKRFADRRTCEKEAHGYNLVTLPPKQEDVCDIDGSPLIQRKDDMPDVVSKRFEEYMEKTHPLAEFYRKKGILVSVDAAPAPDVVYEDVRKIVEGLL